MSHPKFLVVVFLLASAVVQANHCLRDDECPSDTLQNGVSMLQTKLQTNVIEDVKKLARVEVEEAVASTCGGECLSGGEHVVALFQTNLQMNVRKGSTHAAAMQEDRNPQPNNRTLPSSLVKPTNEEEFWSFITESIRPSSFITETSGKADAVVVAAKLRQSVVIAILVVLLVCVCFACSTSCVACARRPNFSKSLHLYFGIYGRD